MTTMRTYGDGCGIAHALDVVGERWALLVVRELLLGPKRFTDLRNGLPNASPNVLTQRLKELEQAAVVQRRKLPPPAGSSIYELTEWGRELKPIVMSLGAWAIHSPSFPPDAPVGGDSVLLALGTFFDAGAADGLSARYELRLGEDTVRVQVADGAIDVERGTAITPDAVITTDVATFRALLWAGRDLADTVDAGEITIEGDHGLVARFLKLFPQPQPGYRAR